jgi:hypothetical protein
MRTRLFPECPIQVTRRITLTFVDAVDAPDIDYGEHSIDHVWDLTLDEAEPDREIEHANTGPKVRCSLLSFFALKPPLLEEAIDNTIKDSHA